VVVIGTDQQIQEAKALVGRLSPTGVELATQTYCPAHLSVERARSLIENVVLAPGSGLPPPAAIHQDTQSGRLFITAERTTHAAIAALLEQEDRPLPEPQRPLRIYRPRNRKAGELLTTLSQLLSEATGVTALEEPAAKTSASNRFKPAGRNRQASPTGIVQVPPVPPVQEALEDRVLGGQSGLRVQGPDYVLTVDEHTNSILAIGTREFHAQLESLIDDLDQRRPQVLIEMTLVAITMSDSMDLGVELQALDLGDAWDYLVFSNFGLSSIDVATGQRVLTPGVGANGVILSPEEVPILFRALATRANARTLSTPKLLVSDNARGTLRNVEEAPFTSVNASDTVATTSFAGFESAGTTLSVTPHILQGDHLTLEYELTFSNFSGSSASAAIPPPRTTNSFTSTVEVPDGHTVVTGGLMVDNDSDAISEVPLLGRIPGLGKLFQSRSRQKTKTKIFAFIRPLIQRDDRFADLKLITLKDTESADILSDEVPPGKPQWMK
jgi:type II secretory pathway component GspD/PulD (secretin)